MKLISARIENFGKLRDASFDFSEHCQIFCKENGWGKSTLAAFLCVMFYGFDGEKKRDELVNERKRYQPWQKGTYGGSVVFAVGGKSYVMTRIFGKKEAEDEFRLRSMDTNLESADYSKNIGEELFQIDRESFCRTIFVSQQDCETYATDAVNAKIGNLIHQSDDVNNFAAAISRLKDITNSMRPNHKKGSLNRLKEEIADLENQIRNEEILSKRMEETDCLRLEQVEKSKNLQKELEQMEKRQQALSGELDLQSVRTEYKSLCALCDEEKNTLDMVTGRFLRPDAIPSEEEVEEYQEREKNCRKLADFIKANELSEQELEQYHLLTERWGGKYPAEERIAELELDNQKLGRLRREMASYELTAEEVEYIEKVKKEYQGDVPSVDVVGDMQRSLREARQKEETLTAKRATLAMLSQMENDKKSMLPFLLVAIPALLLAVGVMMFHLAAGMVLLAIEAAGIVFAITRRGKRVSAGAENRELRELREQVAQDEQFVAITYDNIYNFISKYEQDAERDKLESLLDSWVHRIRRYQELSEKRGDTDGQENERHAQQLAASIRAFLQQFVPEVQEEESWATQLAALRVECANMKRWTEKRDDDKRAKEAYEEQFGELRTYLTSLGYGDVSDTEHILQELWKNVRDYGAAVARYDKALDRKGLFEKAHDRESLLHESKEETEGESLAELTEKIHEAGEQKKAVEQLIRQYESRLLQDMEQWDLLQEMKAELEEKRERYKDGLQKYERLCKTMELLQEAKTQLTAKYLEPVKRGFQKYYQMMSGEGAERYQFDADVNLTVTEHGLQRETRFLSEGRQDLVGICTRLAFVDAMYQKEKPFLIMDDPFVNLDAEKTKRALNFLECISRDYQVIYFSCHTSRTGNPDGQAPL